MDTMSSITQISKQRHTKKVQELWKEIKDLIKSINNNSDDYGNKYLKIRLNSHGDIPFNRTL